MFYDTCDKEVAIVTAKWKGEKNNFCDWTESL